MNILYYTYSFPSHSDPIGGIFFYQRVAQLLKDKHFVPVVKENSIIKSSGQLLKIKSYKIKIFDDDLPVQVEPINYFKNPFFMSSHLLKQIKKKFEKMKGDFIHTHMAHISYPIYLVKKKYHIPYVVTVHGSDVHTIPFQSKKERAKVLKILHHADLVIFVSTYLLKKAQELGYQGQNYEIIPNGIHLPAVQHERKDQQNLIKTIGFIGNLINVKGADLLPAIFYEIKKANPQVQFVIIGEGILKKQIAKELEEYGLMRCTEITGRISPAKLEQYYSKLDLLVIPSRNEGFGCVILEAFSFGVQVVGSQCGSLPELIGEKGRVVQMNDNFIPVFADQVIELLKNPISSDKLISYVKQYSWKKTVEKEIKAYHKIFSK
ncbi:MAG: glycosyltransferase [Spirochaetes bacterium]|nr:glycosyltransferase [Spirochaetota bacterium]